MFRMLEDVEEVTLRHADTDFVFKLRQPGGLLRRRQLLQVRCSVGIDAQLGVGREPGIDRGGQRRQFGFQRGGKILAPFGNTESGAVGRQPCLAFYPRQKLRAIAPAVDGSGRARTALYLRVSTADQKPDLQYDGLRTYAAQPGLDVVQDYCDVGVSAAILIQVWR